MIVTNLLTLHAQLRVFHWQTKIYSEHQALGMTYDAFSGLIDEFIEVFMGKYGRIHNGDGFIIELKNYTDTSSETLINKYIEYLTVDILKSLKDTDTELLNIRDEMLQHLNKLKYLLTLH